jgi:autotransporter-associated beta strand protein
MRTHPYLHRAGRLGLLPLICLALRSVDAGSATWNLDPVSSDWNDPLNWTPNTVPNGEEDVATFEVSHTTGVRIIEFNQVVDLDRVDFTSTASSYTLMVGQHYSAHLNLNGLGIVNDSGVTQNILSVSGGIEFHNGSNAGLEPIVTVNSIGVLGNGISFFDTSSAGNATITANGLDTFIEFDDDSTAASATFSIANYGFAEFTGNATAENATLFVRGGNLPFNFGGSLSFDENATGGTSRITLRRGSASSGRGAILAFADNSSADQARITAEGGTLDADQRAEITFSDTATAGDAAITLKGALESGGTGATLSFDDGSSAANSVLIANNGRGSNSGGSIHFNSASTGGTSRIELLGPASSGGTLDIGGHGSSGLAVGSIEGDGVVVLGNRKLTIGTNNLSTTLAGSIQNTGSITKVGTGTLTLTGANTYTGGTTISSGILLVNNLSGSGTGTGAVSVNAGTLGGSGIIGGAVTVGTNTGVQAFLAPSKGVKKPATLTIQSALTLNDDSTYVYKLDTKRARADEVAANGVVIDSGAKVSFRPSGNNALTSGQVFTVISNTGASPIVGAFHNLRDGQIITVNGSNLQASYTGGEGNDLTLTVVP